MVMKKNYQGGKQWEKVQTQGLSLGIKVWIRLERNRETDIKKQRNKETKNNKQKIKEANKKETSAILDYFTHEI